MTPKDVIKSTINMCHPVLTAYLSDLDDKDLMLRSVPGANHIAWQLGHLIASEHQMLTDAGLGMPDLPDGFMEAYTPETSKSDDASRFHSKQQYLAWMEEQRAATLSNLDTMPEADLDKVTPESMRDYAPTVGAALNLVGLHEMMHAAQFVAVRRKLEKPVLI